MQRDFQEVLNLAKLARIMVRKIAEEKVDKKTKVCFRGKPTLAKIKEALSKIGKPAARNTIEAARCALKTVRRLIAIKKRGTASMLFTEDTNNSRGTPSLDQMEAALSEIVHNAQAIVPKSSPGTNGRMRC